MPAVSIDEITEKRCAVLRRNGYTILEKFGCPDTGAGVILTRQKTFQGAEEVANFFKPRTHKRIYRTEKVTSNHQRLKLPDRLRELLAAEAAAKKAPHDLVVGEIMATIWGVTMQGVRFYRVVGIPTPNSVELAAIGQHYVSGDWMSGSVMPDEGEQPDPQKGTEVYKISMESGEPMGKGLSSIERMRRWNGKPVSVYSD